MKRTRLGWFGFVIVLGLLVAMAPFGCEQPPAPEPTEDPVVTPPDPDAAEPAPADPAPVEEVEPVEPVEPVEAVEPDEPAAPAEEGPPAPVEPADPEPVAVEGLEYPLSVAVAPGGAIYVADLHRPGVWRIEEGRLSLFFEADPRYRTPLNAVRCLAIDDEGRLLAGDSATGDVYRFDAAGQPESLTGRDRPLGEITVPTDIAVDAAGDLFVSDMGDHRVMRVPKDGGAVELFAEVHVPRGLTFDAQGRLWVISGRSLLRFSPEGEPETVVEEGAFEFPHTVAVREDGVAFVCDGYAGTIWRIAPGEAPEPWASGPPLNRPVGMRLWGDRLLVADPHARAVFEIDAEGRIEELALELEAP